MIRLTIALVVVCSLLVSMAGIGAAQALRTPPLNSANRPAAATGSIVIGGLFSLTGNAATLGQASEFAAEIAVEDINSYLESIASASRVVFIVEDTKLDPATAAEKLPMLAEQGARIVIGPQTSSELAAVKPWADANGVIVVSTASTATTLSIPGDNIFRFTPDGVLEGQATAALMWADGIRTVIPVSRQDAGNDGLRDATKKAFEAMGGKMTEGIRYGAAVQDFPPTLDLLSAEIATASKDGSLSSVAVYLAAFDEASDVFVAAKDNPVFSSVKWYGSDGVALIDVFLGNPMAAMFAAKNYYPNPMPGVDQIARDRWEPLSKRIIEKTGRNPGTFSLGVYDAMWVATLAQLAAGDGASIETLKTAFVGTASNFFGATGWAKLNDAGDRQLGWFEFWAVRKTIGGESDDFEWVRVARVAVTPDSAGPIFRENENR